MVTESQRTPLETAFLKALSSATGIAGDLVVNNLIDEMVNSEFHYSQLGEGVPPLDLSVSIHEGWHAIGMMAKNDFH